MVAACAAERADEIEFLAGAYSLSRLAAAAEPPPGARPVRVPAVDALALLEQADLAKIDIEGGEWAIVGDPRFADSAPPAVVLEYHPELCPEPRSARPGAAVPGSGGAGGAAGVESRRRARDPLGMEAGGQSAPRAPTCSTPAAGSLVIRGGVLRTVGYGVGIVLSVVAVAILIRHLGASDFGRYVTVISLITIVGSLAEAGLTNSASASTRRSRESGEMP